MGVIEDMDIKYYKEQQQSYLVVKNDDKTNEFDYQKKLLSIKKINHVLPLAIRRIDDEFYTYYNISSKISLEQIYGSRRMDSDEIAQLMSGIELAVNELDKYLLDYQRLILNPRFIFYGLGSGSYYFMYDVVNEDKSFAGNSKCELMDFLLEHVSPEDQMAGEFVYSTYEYGEAGNIDIADIIAIWKEKVRAYNEKHQTTIIKEEDNKLSDFEETVITHIEETASESINFEGNIPEIDAPAPVGYGFLFGMSVVGLLGIAACASMYYFLVMTEREKYILAACVAFFLSLFAVGICQIIKRKGRCHENEAVHAAISSVPSEEIGCRENRYYDDVDVNSFLVDRAHKPDVKRISCDSHERDDDKTVFFEEDTTEGKYKLYSLDKKNKQHIEIDKFPYTIGKMTGYVDCCINHPSVSRLHVRFGKKDNALTLEDLNSTNGVYLNGIKLSPNDVREIEVGDEIRIGSLNYCLRCG